MARVSLVAGEMRFWRVKVVKSLRRIFTVTQRSRQALAAEARAGAVRQGVPARSAGDRGRRCPAKNVSSALIDLSS